MYEEQTGHSAEDMSREEIQRALFTIIEEVADTVATFDGRLGYTAVTTDGRCVLAFASAEKTAEIQIQAQVNRASVQNGANVQVTLARTSSDGTYDKPQVVYDGEFNASSVRHHLGAALADWYGRVIRAQ